VRHVHRSLISLHRNSNVRLSSNFDIQLLQKTGQIERTVDHEFADEEVKFKSCVFLFITILQTQSPSQHPLRQIREGMRSPTEREQSLSRWHSRCVTSRPLNRSSHRFPSSYSGMTSAQTRVADTIELFFTASDRTSDGALAANAYKRAVEDLDHSVTRELVHLSSSSHAHISSDNGMWIF